MSNSSHNQCYKVGFPWPSAASAIVKFKEIFLIATFVLAGVVPKATAQQPTKPNADSLSSESESAVDMIQQEIDGTKTLDDGTQRITVLVRAADMLWPLREERARAALKDAFELATLHSTIDADKRLTQSVTKDGRQIVLPMDLRFIVIGVIAKHDVEWARKLIVKMLKEDAKERSPESSERNSETSTRLLDAALQLLPANVNLAVTLAQRSLRSTAVVALPVFLYRLAAISQSEADRLYVEALTAYQYQSMDEFLYLSAYPFGNEREAGDIPSTALYQVPANFFPNTSLQRSFLQILLGRSQQQTIVPDEAKAELSDAQQIWLALSRLEPQLRQSMPDLIPAVQQARDRAYSALSPDSQISLSTRLAARSPSTSTFDDQVETAEKQTNVDRRDQLLSFAVIRVSGHEKLDHVIAAVEKISDAQVRNQLLDWLYFMRSQSALRINDLKEARRLALKVEELDQRAYLYSEIAKNSLKTAGNRGEAIEILEEVVTTALKAPQTTVTARALLGIAFLFTKLDLNRSVAVLGDAIKCINRLEFPDFSQNFVIRKIEGKTFGAYAMMPTPGFDPESTLRAIGIINLDSALSQAAGFRDKYVRALTMLALADVWLSRIASQRKEQTKKANHKSPTDH